MQRQCQTLRHSFAHGRLLYSRMLAKWRSTGVRTANEPTRLLKAQRTFDARYALWYRNGNYYGMKCWANNVHA